MSQLLKAFRVGFKKEAQQKVRRTDTNDQDEVAQKEEVLQGVDEGGMPNKAIGATLGTLGGLGGLALLGRRFGPQLLKNSPEHSADEFAKFLSNKGVKRPSTGVTSPEIARQLSNIDTTTGRSTDSIINSLQNRGLKLKRPSSAIKGRNINKRLDEIDDMVATLRQRAERLQDDIDDVRSQPEYRQVRDIADSPGGISDTLKKEEAELKSKLSETTKQIKTLMAEKNMLRRSRNSIL